MLDVRAAANSFLLLRRDRTLAHEPLGVCPSNNRFCYHQEKYNMQKSISRFLQRSLYHDRWKRNGRPRSKYAKLLDDQHAAALERERQAYLRDCKRLGITPWQRR
jgi:hypothetical protein